MERTLQRKPGYWPAPVLDVYQQLYDATHPVICTDESNKQIIDDVKDPLPMEPGQVMKQDCNYKRKGTSNLLIAFEPATV